MEYIEYRKIFRREYRKNQYNGQYITVRFYMCKNEGFDEKT